jgi:hypothetical protein
MKKLLGLTIQEIKNLDMADLERILELTPGWMSLGPIIQKDYRASLQYVCETLRVESANPWILKLLEAGARRFRGELYMNANIFNYVSPEEIDDIFDKLIEIQEELDDAYADESIAKQNIEKANVGMARQEGFKWGRNETEREAQSREFVPKLWNELDRVQAVINELQGAKRIQELMLDRIELLRDMFSTKEYDIPSEKLGAS